MITTNAYAKALLLPMATTADWVMGGLFCFLLPSVFLYLWEKKLHSQYLQQCRGARVSSESLSSTAKQRAGRLDGEELPGNVDESLYPTGGLRKQECDAGSSSGAMAATTTITTITSSSNSSTTSQGMRAVQQLGNQCW